MSIAALHLPDAAATEAAGAHLAGGLAGGMIVTLSGDLGAGKTTLVRGCLEALGWMGPVKSPSYPLVEHYPLSSLYFYHFDFYRFNEPEEFLDAGLDEYFSGHGVCLVEWPDKALPYLGKPDLTLDLHLGSTEHTRNAHLQAFTERGRTCLSSLTGVASLALPPAH